MTRGEAWLMRCTVVRVVAMAAIFNAILNAGLNAISKLSNEKASKVSSALDGK